MSTYSATGSANGTAQTSTTPSSIVTSNATSTATSNISQEDAQNVANNTAQSVANSAAQNDANIINQVINITTSSVKGQYSYLNITYQFQNYNYLSSDFNYSGSFIVDKTVLRSSVFVKPIYDITSQKNIIGNTTSNIMLDYDGLLRLFGTRYFTTSLTYGNITYFFAGVTEANWELFTPLSFNSTSDGVSSVTNFTTSNIKSDTILFLTLTGNVIVIENKNVYSFSNVKITRGNNTNEKDELWWIRTINFDSATRIS